MPLLDCARYSTVLIDDATYYNTLAIPSCASYALLDTEPARGAGEYNMFILELEKILIKRKIYNKCKYFLVWRAVPYLGAELDNIAFRHEGVGIMY